MKRITVSAPGKLMLLGEHAVVYHRPCLVTAVDQRLQTTVEEIENQMIHIEAPDVHIHGYSKQLRDLGNPDIPQEVKFIEIAARNLMKKYPLTNGIKITTKSDFSSQYGFGSSSAATVGVVYSLAQLYGLNLSDKEMFDICYQTILDVQGKGSGFDIAAAIYGGTLHFVTGGEIINQLNIHHLPLLVSYSGIKSDTVTEINHVLETSTRFPEITEEIFNGIEDIVMFAKEALLDNTWDILGELMNFNQGYLEMLGVSSRKLTNLIYAARDSGSYGAKLSGAGRGDCIIVVAPAMRQDAIAQAISQAGGEVIPVTTNAQGVRIEEE